MDGSWLKGYGSVLAKHDVRALFSALLISTTGSWAYNVALLAFVFDRTHSLGWVGAAGFVRFVPQLVLSAYGGVIAERTERIRLMMGSDLLSALWQGLLAVVAATNGAPALALALAGLTAVSGVVYQPATAATIPSIVDEDDLAAANALNSTIEQLVVIAGPAVGALLLVIGSAVVRVRDQRRELRGVRPDPVADPCAQPPGRRDRGGDGRATAPDGGRSENDPRPLGRADAGRVQRAGQLRVWNRHDAVHRRLRARLGTGPEGFGYLLAGLGVGGVLAAGAVNRLAGSRRLGAIILPARSATACRPRCWQSSTRPRSRSQSRSSAAPRRWSSTCSRSLRCSARSRPISSRACSACSSRSCSGRSRSARC